MTVTVHTPTTSTSDVTISPGSRVSHCSRHTSVLGCRMPPTTAATGTTVSTAATMAYDAHPAREKRADRAWAVTCAG